MRALLLIFAVCVIAFGQNPNTAKFPGSVATDTDLPVASNRFRTTLASGINSSTLSISVAQAPMDAHAGRV
jgi:hypothetical protein